MGIRICTRCRQPYYRCNKIRVWSSQNPGSRTGWQRDEASICTNCMGPSMALRTLKLAQVGSVVGRHITKAKRRRTA